MTGTYSAPLIPSAFIWRRAHSLTGLWLVLFLIEHLLTNSQAALFIGDDGNGFVRAVNFLKNLPYLPVIEITLLGIPFLIHAVWGIQYLMTAKYNVLPTDGSSPSLPQYSRNQAYTWQRMTSWILLIGIIAHVIQMRGFDYPTSFKTETESFYLVRVKNDPSLETLSKRFSFSFYDSSQVKSVANPLRAALQEWPLKEDQRVIVAPSFGVAELLVVRDTFKSPLMMLLYTGLVLAACFHGFNGLWTFMISWGITLTARSQQGMRACAVFLMVLVTLLGFAAIWSPYI